MCGVVGLKPTVELVSREGGRLYIYIRITQGSLTFISPIFSYPNLQNPRQRWADLRKCVRRSKSPASDCIPTPTVHYQHAPRLSLRLHKRSLGYFSFRKQNPNRCPSCNSLHARGIGGGTRSDHADI